MLLNAGERRGYTKKMKIVGIDPAPGKGTHIFSEKLIFLDHTELQSFLEEIGNNKEACLICWDAPLTGPHSPNSSEIKDKDFTQRVIESFFSRQATGFKTPKGISVLGYAGCPHWAITRYMLGLPRIGKYDKGLSKLPFRLITGNDLFNSINKFVVEVHPAVAIWLWCKHLGGIDFESWNYKGDLSILENIWRTLKAVLTEHNIIAPEDLNIFTSFTPKSDDELDSFISWLLGKLWIRNPQAVTMLGSAETGSFLVPKLPKLLRSWDQFTKSIV